MQGVRRLFSQTRSNWLTAGDGFCIHGWKSINFRLSYGPYLNWIRGQMYAFCISLAGVFLAQRLCELCLHDKVKQVWVCDDHSQKHQGPPSICIRSTTPQLKASSLEGYCDNLPHFAHIQNIANSLWSLCMDFSKHLWKDKPLDFKPVKGRSAIIKGKWLNPFFEFDQTWEEIRVSLVAQLEKKLPAMWEAWARSLGWEDPLEKGRATHSSILAWKILWSVYSHGVEKSWTQLNDFHFDFQEEINSSFLDQNLLFNQFLLQKPNLGITEW